MDAVVKLAGVAGTGAPRESSVVRGRTRSASGRGSRARQASLRAG